MSRTNYKRMDVIAYVKQYCEAKWANFEGRFKSEHKWSAYEDIVLYYDDENKIVIIDRFNIGD